MQKIVVSGIQPTGFIHLGNYFGAIKNWISLIDPYSCFFFIADLHACTIPGNIANIDVLSTTAGLLAAGLNPKKCFIFRQSKIPQHCQLMWHLMCYANVSRLKKMTQYKIKSEDGASAGLLCYPILQSADILLYQADFVPVGEDQTQHLELTKDIAEKYNKFYGQTFKIPQILKLNGSKINSLISNSKMSKSDKNPMSRIDLSDTKDTISAKIKAALTDCINIPSYDPEARPSVSNLLTIYKGFLENSNELPSFTSMQDLKSKLTDLLINEWIPISKEYHRLYNDKVFLQSILQENEEKVQCIAQKNFEQIIKS